MTSSSVIRNVRPMGGAATDVVLADGAISQLLPAGAAPADLPTLVVGEGRLMVPALVEAHTHFDKTLWGTPWRPNSAGPTRNHRISNEQQFLKDFPVPVAERARCTAR